MITLRSDVPSGQPDEAAQQQPSYHVDVMVHFQVQARPAHGGNDWPQEHIGKQFGQRDARGCRPRRMAAGERPFTPHGGESHSSLRAATAHHSLEYDAQCVRENDGYARLRPLCAALVIGCTPDPTKKQPSRRMFGSVTLR
jgi:hypothetical protein